jgi:hypothetical protein
MRRVNCIKLIPPPLQNLESFRLAPCVDRLFDVGGALSFGVAVDGDGGGGDCPPVAGERGIFEGSYDNWEDVAKSVCSMREEREGRDVLGECGGVERGAREARGGVSEFEVLETVRWLLARTCPPASRSRDL